MKPQRPTTFARIARSVAGVALAAAVAFGLLPASFGDWGGGAAQAAIAPVKCPGNVCTDVILVGGSSVAIAWTQHLSPAGELRVRFNGGPMATASLISHIITNLPPFASWDKLANPTNGAVYLPTESVNPGNTAYERRDADGCTTCIVDEVLSVKYTALAAGAYTFDVLVVQNNASAIKTGYTFYVDPAAPSNMNESNVFAVVPNMDYPCADAVDNDVDYRGDCADVQCAGSVGQVASGAKCEAPESTCNDGFDNDADGLIDCLDPDCNGKVGQIAPGTARCQFGNETGAGSCGDNFDNDGDGFTDCVDNAWSPVNGGTANSICWKKPAFGCPATETSCSNGLDDDKDKSYDAAWDASPLTGADCKDYDCAGNPACPAAENKLSDGTEDDTQCFNHIDDDLDGKIDCADPDCLGVINPSSPDPLHPQKCVDKEFDLGQHYQYCSNKFDDDGDTPIDCDDSDCKQKFGNCGPCPSVEAIAYDSCADGKDNDTDGLFDCADTANCTGQLGSTPLAASCLAAENTATACSDGFDNDRDGKLDCADSDCAGFSGPQNQTCQPAGETTCTDGADNDGDGLIDCADPNCQGVGSCAAKTWVDAACVAVPHDTGPASFTSNAPTVFATYRDAGRAGAGDVIRVTGTATYSAISLIIGDNRQPSTYYPYASTAGCTLTNTGTAVAPTSLGFTALDGRYVYIFHKTASVAPFDVTLTCATPATPNALRSYPMNLLAGRASTAEYGIISAGNTLYEGTKPTFSKFEPEGEVAGTLRVPYALVPDATSRRIRGVPNDPGVPPNSSGICKCDISVNGAPSVTSSDCTTTPLAFQMDGTLSLSGTATDGAANVSNALAASFALNVTPVVTQALTVSPAKPFFRAGRMKLTVDSRFITGGGDTIPSCDLFIRDSSGNIRDGATGGIYFGAGSTKAFSSIGGLGNTAECAYSFDMPPLPDGTYYATVQATDSDGDKITTNRQVFYVCNSVAAAGAPSDTNGCQFADFDGDGASEGLYSTPPMYAATPLACDNCENDYNPGQQDDNANGIGDDCEPEDSVVGRCEVDTDLVCKYDSDNPRCATDQTFCCPGPSIADQPGMPAGTKKNPQLCKQDWCVCTFDGKIGFADADCTAGGSWGTPAVPPANAGWGRCQDGNKPCKHDAECGAPLTGVAKCSGANVCSNLLNAWLQTQQGSLFSKKRISADEAPPAGQFNASFCILSKELVLNFTTAQCGVSVDATTKLERPKQSNAYTSVLGKLDVAGLRAGKYGAVVNVGGSLDSSLDTYASRLGGRVFRVTGDATLSTARTYLNGTGSGANGLGGGTILVDGGDLYINAEQGYDGSAPATLETLASLGVVVLPAADGSKGNVYVRGSVHNVVGAFYVGGDDGFWTVAPPDTDSPEAFTLSGLAVAKSFHLSRSFRSKSQGSEVFRYDGRAVANPPPGFADVTKSLPLFTDALP